MEYNPLSPDVKGDPNPLVRTEARVAFERVLLRLVKLSRTNDRVERVNSSFLRRTNRLPPSLEPARAGAVP